MKIVAMIPARLGSKRIKHKNLRLLDGKPLVSHVLEKCKVAGIFSEIYINSESGIFKSVADEYGVKLYLRDPIFATDDATNDQFILDFIKVIPGILKADVKSRVIMSPMHTKNLLLILNVNPTLLWAMLPNPGLF